MQLNAAYNFFEKNEHINNEQELYEEVDDYEQPVTNAGGEPKNTLGKQRRVNVALALALVATLALAVIAIIISVLPTSNSNQEIQSLQLEIENLREILNQTGHNFNWDIQSLHQEIKSLRVMLNQTDRSIDSHESRLTKHTQTQNGRLLIHITLLTTKFNI